MKIRGSNLVFLFVFVIISVVQLGCSKSQPAAISARPTVEAPTPPPTPTITPTPVVVSTPTPSPPYFETIRANMEAMTPEQADQYVKELGEKELVNWSGQIAKKILIDMEQRALLMEMDTHPMERPDLVLLDIDPDVWNGLEEKQRIRFSTKAKGFIDVEEIERILALEDVVIQP